MDVMLEDFRSLVLESVRLLLSDITSRDSIRSQHSIHLWDMTQVILHHPHLALHLVPDAHPILHLFDLAVCIDKCDLTIHVWGELTILFQNHAYREVGINTDNTNKQRLTRSVAEK